MDLDRYEYLNNRPELKNSLETTSDLYDYSNRTSRDSLMTEERRISCLSEYVIADFDAKYKDNDTERPQFIEFMTEFSPKNLDNYLYTRNKEDLMTPYNEYTQPILNNVYKLQHNILESSMSNLEKSLMSAVCFDILTSIGELPNFAEEENPIEDKEE